MSTLGLAASRVRAAVPALLALLLIVVVAVTALGTTTGLVQHRVAAGAAVTLADAAAQSAAVRVTTHLAEDATAQDAAATGLFGDLFPQGTFTVHRSEVSLAVPMLAGGTAGPESTALFARLPDLADRVTITAGAWPASGSSAEAPPVAVQADAAASLGLGVGDVLTVGTAAIPVSFEVAALWRATDPTSPTWFADSAVTAGRAGGASGLFVVEQDLTVLPTQHFAVWTLSATPAAAGDQNRAAVLAGLRHLGERVDAAPGLTVSSSTTEGDLAGTLQRIDAAGRGATAIGITAIFIIGMLGIVALMQVSTVLVGSRREQTALLRARGLALGQHGVLVIAEGLLVTIPGSLIGLVATGVLVAAVTGSDPSGPASGAVPFALGVSVAGVVVLAVTVLSEPAGPGRSPRRSLATFAVSFGIIGAAAVLAIWQLHAQGSPVRAGGDGGADLVTATSPALALIAIAALGTMGFVVLAPLRAARAVRRGSVVSLLADSQLGSRATRYLVPILALAITIASAAFATGIATTWQNAQVQAQLIGTGPTVDIDLHSDATAPAATEPVNATRYAAIDGVRAAAAVVVSRVRLGSDSVPVVSIRPDAAETLLGDAGGEFAAALRTTSPSSVQLELPATATGVQASVSFGETPPAASFAVSIWASDADGSLARIPLAEPAGAAGPGSVYSGVLPAGTRPWRLVAVEAERSGPPDAAVPTLLVDRFAGTADGAASPLDPSMAVSLDIAAALPRSRAVIGSQGPAALPVVVTTALADRVGVSVGDPLAFGFGASGALLDAQVSAIVQSLPGSGSRLGIATDLAALNNATLQQGRSPVLAGNIWLDTDTPDTVSTTATTVATSTAVLSSHRTTTAAPILQPAMDAFWIAAAAAGLLALITFSAFIADDSRLRRTGIPVLRALGLSSAQLTRARARELLFVLVFALIAGAVAGIGATLIAVAPFVAAAVPGSGGYLSVVPALDPLPWLGFSTAVVAGALLVIGVALERLNGSGPEVRS
ncbi:hypothetical protein E3T61_14890 [Cryobacterium lactosi]|uniref:FtsX-like permease family protein n=1 Tax=Cryobacterium lactosi TaxID=1259202 RepID=A0A4R9BLW5_9MICO|nr:hypothetical protein [Cryobacterium lactosi]TFD87129.1 hypothetical protein E3T61_14890 [Cryobacterium lactosi]